MKPDNQLINNQLANVLMDPNLPIKAYIQSCSLLYQRAMASMSENNLELAFIYLLRAASLIMTSLVPTSTHAISKGTLGSIILGAVVLIHPDYPLLPPNFQASLQADGHRYINELAPLKARLSQRHSEVSHYDPVLLAHHSVKTANSSSKSRINFRPLKSSNPPVSSASRSLLYSDIRKTTSSSQKFNSTPPLSQSSSIDPLKLYNSSTQNLKQSISPPSSPSHLNSNKTSLDDWQLMDDSDLHPNQKIPKTSRHQLSGSSDRNQSIWPCCDARIGAQ
ncbi:hypothetical protein BY996DRAFT_6624364 [Phakopsora pachyrhizi]|nr:hypothetical protein BY996DRAFT_6624364 [Phakopsora pachyrhizi]